MPDTPEHLMALGIDARPARLLGYTTYAGDPTNNLTPEYIGQFCYDTSGTAFYIATTAAASGWAVIHS